MNAADVSPERLLTSSREAEDLVGLGYAVAELDLRDHREAEPDDLAAELADVALLWVVGGNAFALARAATAAGLREALRMTSDLTYGGRSAGACLTGIDLQGIELMDDRAAAAPGYAPDMFADTLRLVDERFVTHGGTPDADAAERELRRRGLRPFVLRDGQDAFFVSPGGGPEV